MTNYNRMAPITLASYALLKALTDSNEYKNQYEMLSEFIRYIIVKRKLREFLLIDIQNALNEEFSFTIPQAAIKTSIKQIQECNKSGDHYSVENTAFNTDSFVSLQTVTEDANKGIVDKLACFARTVDDGIKKEALEDAFIKFLIDDSVTTGIKYSEIISRFLIENEKDEAFQKQIKEIREGSILYCGLTYNMTELGSIRDNLTLFLDTEVLFNIAGYNGTLYQRLAEDLMNQVKSANVGQQRIKLRFFREVRQEIDSFFRSAEHAVLGKGELIQNTAMRSITNGCEFISDVRIKQSDFYNLLRVKYGIIQDEKDDYYTEVDYQYNIEAIPDGFEEDEKSYEAVKFISHINKLRKGNNEEDYIKSRYLLVTETRRIQEIANALQEGYTCAKALPTSVITNILWFKLGCGFSKKDYPSNVDVSYKARGIISGILTSSVSKAFEDVKRNYREGILTKEQVADRIVMLREKTQSPDGITADNLNELMDFSPEAIDHYEQGIKANKVQIEEQVQIITQLEAENEAGKDENARLKESITRLTDENDLKDQAILENEERLATQDKTIQDQNFELEQLRKEKKEREERIEKRKKRGKFAIGLLIAAEIFFCAVFLVTKIIESIAPESNSAIGYIIDASGVVGFLTGGVSSVKKIIYGGQENVSVK